MLARARLHVVACVHADAADAARPLFVFVRQVVGEGREGRWKGEREGDAVEWSVLSTGEAIFGRGVGRRRGQELISILSVDYTQYGLYETPQNLEGSNYRQP